METPEQKRSRLLRFACICALVCWNLQLLYSYVEWYTTGDKFAWSTPDGVFTADFLRFYVAGEIARSPDSARIYEIPTHLPYMNNLVAPLVVQKNSSLSLLPSLVLLMSGVSMLPLMAAYVLFMTASVAFALISLSSYLRKVRNFSKVDTLIFCLASMASLSAATGIRTGQLVFLLIGFAATFLLMSARRRDKLAGVMLGLMAMKPQYCLPLIALCCGLRRGWTVGVAGLTIALSNGLAAFLIGLDNVIHYPQKLAALEKLKDVGVFPKVHASFRGFFSNIFPEATAFSISSSLYWLPLICLTATSSRIKEPTEEQTRWLIAIAFLVGMVFAPSMFSYDLTLICLPAALTLETLSPQEVLKMKSAAAKSWHLILFAYPTLTWIIGMLGSNVNFIYAFINIGLIAIAIWKLREIQS